MRSSSTAYRNLVPLPLIGWHVDDEDLRLDKHPQDTAERFLRNRFTVQSLHDMRTRVRTQEVDDTDVDPVAHQRSRDIA